MSALPPKADMCTARGHVCFVPIADSCTATNRKTASRGGLSEESLSLLVTRDTRNLPLDALPRLLPVNRSAERSQRIQIRRRVVTDQIDRPCAKQEKRCSDGDNGGPDHGATLLLLLPVWIRSESCVMCVGLLCFRHNIADANAC